MSDSEEPNLAADLKALIDVYYLGPDEPQEGMTFQPGDKVRIERATGAKDPQAWEGLLCGVIKSYHHEEMEMTVLVPMEPRPDTHKKGEEEWFVWRADLLEEA